MFRARFRVVWLGELHKTTKTGLWSQVEISIRNAQNPKQECQHLDSEVCSWVQGMVLRWYVVWCLYIFILECNIFWRFVKCYVMLADLKKFRFWTRMPSSSLRVFSHCASLNSSSTCRIVIIHWNSSLMHVKQSDLNSRNCHCVG